MSKEKAVSSNVILEQLRLPRMKRGKLANGKRKKKKITVIAEQEKKKEDTL